MQMVDLVNKSGSLLPPLALKGADDLEEEVHINPKMMMMKKQKQGIVSILGLHETDHKTGGTTYNKAVASLRRTLSADMSSKKWLEQSGLINPSSSFSSSHVPMKKIPSSLHIASILDSSDEEEVDASSKNNRTQSDVWSSILSQKGDRGEDDASSYVHPQVKRSKSLLSEKSLEICTESLGSETGSDVFTSSDPVSDEEKEVEEHKEASQQHGKVMEFVANEEFEAAKCTPYSTIKKAAIAHPFPPPLPSLARSEKSSLHMHSHRRDGRLVVEAVSIPSQNCFQAQRKDGRLLLTLINSTPDHLGVEEVPQSIEKEEEEEEEEEFNGFEDEEIDENSKYVDEVGMFFMEKQEEEPKVASGIINVHGSTVLVTMKKIMERDINTWMNNKYFNYKINNNNNINLMKQLDDVVEDAEELEPIAANQVNGTLAVSQSLPPPPPVSGRQAATSLVNTYQYFWRTKPTMASVIMNHNNPVVAKTSSGQTELVSRLNNSFHKMYEQKESLVVVRGNKTDCTVPTLRGCKEPRRSLLMWEPHCIATS